MNVDLNDVIEWLQLSPIDEDGRLILSRQFIVDNLKLLPPATPDMRHPKIQSLIGRAARQSILLSLVEKILDNPSGDECTASDMEYWEPLHDRLVEALRASGYKNT
jgi:hypothetical protein